MTDTLGECPSEAVDPPYQCVDWEGEVWPPNKEDRDITSAQVATKGAPVGGEGDCWGRCGASKPVCIKVNLRPTASVITVLETTEGRGNGSLV